MTYAIGKNVETCAGSECCQPAEMEINHALVDDEGTIHNVIPLGYCLEHGVAEVS